jgi:hypothetical protein
LTGKGVRETRVLTGIFSQEMDPGFKRALAFSLGRTAPTEESLALLKLFSQSPDASLRRASEAALSNLAKKNPTGNPRE